MARAHHIHNRGKGAGIQFLRANVAYDGITCLLWPLSCDDKGYAVVRFDGKNRKAARVMCEMVKGPPPTPQHEAAHSCGRGHHGCIDPRHLSWKTRAENQRDRRQHGTAGRGLGGYRLRKLTPEQVREIRRLGGKKNRDALARMFGVTPAAIGNILAGRSWKSLVHGE